MNICFSGLQAPIAVDDVAVSVLEVHSRPLFARLCMSLASELGADAVEPYTVWDAQGDELKPVGRFLMVGSPFELPWDDKSLVGGLAARVEQLVFEDEVGRGEIEETFALLRSKLSQLALALESDYFFGVDWELKRYLRTYGFGIELVDDEPLIDKVIKFLMLAKDASLQKALMFVNLKLFLSENELKQFYEQAFFSGLSILLLEAIPDATCYDVERKYIIDQDLLETWPMQPAGLTVLSQ